MVVEIDPFAAAYRFNVDRRVSMPSSSYLQAADIGTTGTTVAVYFPPGG